MTPLDRAHAAMSAAPGEAALRLAFFDRMAGAELFLLLEDEAGGETVRPAVFPVDGGRFVLAFDTEERLTEFVGGEAPFAAMTGRSLAAMLAGQGLGLGLNLGLAPSSELIGPDAVDWLAETLGHAPAEVVERPEEVLAPAGLPEPLIAALDAKLAGAGGLARCAYLVAVRYGGGRRAHLLGVVDPVPGAEAALARAVGEALAFSGIEAGTLDVGFFAASDPASARLARVGLRFDLPEPDAPDVPGASPGTDPDRPPRLR